MFFFLCPFQVIKYVFPIKLPDYFYRSVNGRLQSIYEKGSIVLRDFSGDGILVSGWLLFLAAGWGALAIGFVVYQFMKYRQFKKTVQITSKPSKDKEISSVLERENIKRTCCFTNVLVRTPFTIGVWNHSIVIPELKFSKEIRRMIVLHESAHIQNRDILFKFICMSICILHCFNPFAWFLLHEYNMISEHRCDEHVIETLKTMEEKKQYASAIVLLAAKDTRIPVVFSDYFSRGEKGMKRMKKRVKEILHQRRPCTKWFPIMMAAAILLSSSTAMAYITPVPISVDLLEKAEEGDFIVSIDEITENPLFDEQRYSKLRFLLSNTMFEDMSTGQIAYLYSTRESELYAVCKHIYKTGTMHIHKKISAGGCTVTSYAALDCTKCGESVLKGQLSQITYKKCPH
ncbi:MAG: M56 family metallopeptidase [Lachnospiraceae bacterium]|nr:M56 family metallopeptidase [Lachnospiraceae bacterium]MDD3795894.1 M56 family metallopeptidase [Lachnospiraceae bacterium]